MEDQTKIEIGISKTRIFDSPNSPGDTLFTGDSILGNLREIINQGNSCFEEDRHIVKRIHQWLNSESLDPEKLFVELEKEKDADPSNIYCLAFLVRWEIGTAQDPGNAFKWYEIAADRGDLQAENELGGCYQEGIGCPQNSEKAFFHYSNAAKGGNVFGQTNVGSCYFYGVGTNKDHAEAVRWFQKGAQAGESFSQSFLGDAYLRGKGIRRDARKAIYWYKCASQQEACFDIGSSTSFYSLGFCYQAGFGTQLDVHAAIKVYRKLIQMNYDESLDCLATIFKSNH
ncbi:hypothetical protein G9A89_016874 [Geosiphon pyriformis]|nr:hypothetical protein G9A89_016874 [Geosiphon pyriformis]